MINKTDIFLITAGLSMFFFFVVMILGYLLTRNHITGDDKYDIFNICVGLFAVTFVIACALDTN